MFTPGFGAFGISGVVLMAIGIALTVYTTPLEVISPAVYRAGLFRCSSSIHRV
jgi:membrane-bound ClpP family serine protease